MFWGLIMEPGRCYTQKVKVSFHVSMAALDISNSSDDPAQVMCVFEGRNYLLCTLNKKDKVQCPLDLNFEAGSKVSFATNGKAHVHLSGYLISGDDFFNEEIEEEEVSQIAEKKRPKKEAVDGPPTKKSKTTKNNAVTASEVEEEEDDESDSSFDIDEAIDEEEGDEEESEDEEEGEAEDEEGEEEEDDEDASSLSNEEDEESEEEKVVKPKQNGVTTKTNAKQKQKTQEKVPKEKPKKQEKKEPQQKLKKTVLKGGVIVQDLKEGAGEPVKEGKFVHVYYEGRLKDNNKMFDSTTKGPGFSFRVGKGEVIKGWDIGLVGMKVGGKRRIVCPPKVAYGSDGSPPVIPPNAVLVFDVEVKKIS